MSDVAERVKKIVVEHLGVDADKVVESANFIDDLGADSLDTVELVMAFEEEFGVEIPTIRPRRSRPSATPSNSWRRRPPRRNEPVKTVQTVNIGRASHASGPRRMGLISTRKAESPVSGT